MAQRYHQIVLAVLISTVLLPTFATAQTNWGQPLARCGDEVPSEITGFFWTDVSDRQRSGLAAATLNGDRVETSSAVATTERSVIFRVESLQNGAALAMLQLPSIFSRLDDEKTLSIVTQDGQVLTLAEAQKPTTLNWWRLLPEREPGQFDIFGYDNETNAFIVEVNWSLGGITLGQPQILPFEFSPLNPYHRNWLYISPSQEYIALTRYTQPLQPGGIEFFIYSILERRFVWQTPYDTNAFPSITWLSEGQTVALVSGTTPDTMDQLIAVDRNGQSSTVVDLSTLYGEGVSIFPASTLTVSPTQIAFLLTSQSSATQPASNRLTLLDLEARQIIDLCYTSPPSSLSILEATTNGQIILQESLTSPIVVISTRTGDYSVINLAEGVIPLYGSFEFNDTTETP
jgi:hypothetical protein